MTNDKQLTNQDLYKMRADLYLVQNALARTKDKSKREMLLEKKRNLERELVDALKKNSPSRQYCAGNKCAESKQSTKHVKHLSDLQDSTLDGEFMCLEISRAFRWAVKKCLEHTGLPDVPIVRMTPYEGEQELPLYVRYRDGGLYVKASVTMKITKARKKRVESDDFDAAIAALYTQAAEKCAPYFAQPGNTIGACNYPEGNSQCFVGLFWRGHIIKMTFRVSTFVGDWQEPEYPHDPMEPFSEPEPL